MTRRRRPCRPGSPAPWTACATIWVGTVTVGQAFRRGPRGHQRSIVDSSAARATARRRHRRWSLRGPGNLGTGYEVGDFPGVAAGDSGQRGPPRSAAGRSARRGSPTPTPGPATAACSHHRPDRVSAGWPWHRPTWLVVPDDLAEPLGRRGWPKALAPLCPPHRVVAVAAGDLLDALRARPGTAENDGQGTLEGDGLYFRTSRGRREATPCTCFSS